jgi:hypothetical protein
MSDCQCLDHSLILFMFSPSARSSRHATTRGDGPDPRLGFMARRGSSFSLVDVPDDEMTFSAALTILEVDL